jgi:hypothetical protein
MQNSVTPSTCPHFPITALAPTSTSDHQQRSSAPHHKYVCLILSVASLLTSLRIVIDVDGEDLFFKSNDLFVCQ